MSVKSLTAGVAAGVAVGPGAAVTSGVSVLLAPADARSAVFATPPPLDLAGAAPPAGELISVLNRRRDPSVAVVSKSTAVEGRVDGRIADRELPTGAQPGSPPLSCRVSNITPADPGAASADVTASDLRLAPSTHNVRFVNRGDRKPSHAAAMSPVQDFQAAG